MEWMSVCGCWGGEGEMHIPRAKVSCHMITNKEADKDSAELSLEDHIRVTT